MPRRVASAFDKFIDPATTLLQAPYPCDGVSGAEQCASALGLMADCKGAQPQAAALPNRRPSAAGLQRATAKEHSERPWRGQGDGRQLPRRYACIR